MLKLVIIPYFLSPGILKNVLLVYLFCNLINFQHYHRLVVFDQHSDHWSVDESHALEFGQLESIE